MKPEQWQRIEQLYHAALEREAEERAAFLAEACGGDQSLRREVESLLDFDLRAETFIEAPALEVVAQLQAATCHQPMIGRVIGHHRVLSLLGEGGMGEVYLAQDTLLDRQVALKLLPARFTQDAARLSRFVLEAKAASALNHPNIITIHEIGQSDGVHFITAEYVAGQTLRALMNQSPLGLAAVLNIAQQVTSALAVAHAAGIVHRDIKPENIMVRPDGYVKVLDFGIAKLAEPETPLLEVAALPGSQPCGQIETGFGIVLGTASYMSPEQARGLKVDGRSDIFSLGVVLYEMITGRRPFAGDTSTAVIRALAEQEPQPLSAYAPQIPPALEKTISRALCKDREARYQTAKELLADLRHLKKDLQIDSHVYPDQELPLHISAAAPTGSMQVAAVTRMEGTTRTGERSTPSATKQHFVANSARRRGVMAAGFVLLALLIGGLIYFVRKHPQRAAIESLAVLPFVNAGADASAEYLADGLTESLINSLSQLPKMKVIARSSVFRFKEGAPDPQTVGRQLGVRAVLAGRIAQRGELLTISAELIDVRDGSHLWGDQYERRLADILSVQEEVTRHITAELRAKLTEAEVKQLSKRYTENTEAYHLFLKGRYFFLQFTPDGIRKGIEHFNQAIALDPNYAPAHAGIGYAYAVAASQYETPGEGMSRARQASLRALQIDETLPEAHFSLALVKWWADWDWAAAENEFRRALELNPNFATADAVFSEFLSSQERFEESFDHAARAQDLDPLSLYVSGAMGRALFYARQYDRALAAYQKTLELDPDAARTHRNLGRVLLQQGKYPEAIAELRKAYEREQHHYFLADLGYAYAVAGRRSEARQVLAQLQQLSRQRYISPVYIAKIHAGLGETEQALELLRRGFQDRSDQLTLLRVDPAFDPLRADTRFTELMRRVGLVP